MGAKTAAIMSHIFISYSRQDQAYVSSLIQALESRGLPVWLDDRIDYGTTWPRVIQEHLEQCAVFLVVMSPRSQDSLWVQNELTLAQKLKKPVFPLLLEGDHWFQILTIQSVNVTSGKLPPARFFDTLRPYFPAPAPTSESLPLQDVVEESIATELSFMPPISEQFCRTSGENGANSAEIMTERKLNDQQRLLSRIRESIQLVVAGDEDTCGTFCILGEERKWVQFKDKFVNASYPFDKYPDFGHLLDQSNGILLSKLESWEPDSYACFEFSDFDKLDSHQTELASWIHSYFTKILECPDLFDFEFELEQF